VASNLGPAPAGKYSSNNSRCLRAVFLLILWLKNFSSFISFPLSGSFANRMSGCLLRLCQILDVPHFCAPAMNRFETVDEVSPGVERDRRNRNCSILGGRRLDAPAVLECEQGWPYGSQAWR
jgi:hypothetical protein